MRRVVMARSNRPWWRVLSISAMLWVMVFLVLMRRRDPSNPHSESNDLFMRLYARTVYEKAGNRYDVDRQRGLWSECRGEAAGKECGVRQGVGKAVPSISVPFVQSLPTHDIHVTIAILTVPRPNELRYLEQTIAAVHREFATQPALKWSVLVVNARPGQHTVFSDVERAWRDDHRFVFVNAEAVTMPVVGSDDGERATPLWRDVTERDVAQTTDFIRLLNELELYLRHSDDENALHRLTLLMEDDFEWCPGAVQFHLAPLITRLWEARALQDFTAVRVSYGLNGVIVHSSMLAAMRDLLQDNYRRGPADTLLGSWWTYDPRIWEESDVDVQGEKQYLSYRFNLLRHIGVTSTSGAAYKAGDGTAVTPECYDPVFFSGLYIRENFDLLHCSDVLLSPCWARDADALADGGDMIPPHLLEHHEYCAIWDAYFNTVPSFCS